MKYFARVILPAMLCVAGLAMIVIRGINERGLEVGVPLISTGASIWFIFFLWRVGVAGNSDRDVEADARAYFAEHGHWPDEAASKQDRT